MPAPKDGSPPIASAPDERSHLLYNYLPSVQLIRPPQGKYSPAVDERCFTYCSQTANGRTQQHEPRCKTICLRHVFAHEVRRVMSVYNMNARFSNGQVRTENSELKYPLPPEGQPAPKVDTSIEVGDDDEDDLLKSRPRIVGKEHEKPPERFWQEGWYMWLSKSKYGAQEKIDLMMCDLERQADWLKHKKQVNDNYAVYERLQAKDGSSSTPASPPVPPNDGQDAQPALTSQPLHPASIQERELPPASPTLPFPDVAAESILIPIPPDTTPLGAQLGTLLAPVPKALNILAESLAKDGSQRELARRAWDKAWTAEPFILAKTVGVKMWQVFRAGPPDDPDSKQK